MKIVVISACTPREKLALIQVVANFPNVTVIQKAAKSNAKPKKKSREGFFDFWGKRILSRLHKSAIKRLSLQNAQEKTQFDQFPFDKIEFDFQHINTEEGVAMLQKLQPDILVTCNAPIMRDKVLAVPKIASINFHYGIPPQYRGNNTLFWPWYLRDFEQVGGSIHYIDSGVDRGAILAKVYPALTPKDGELEIDYKTSQLLGVAIVPVLKALLKGGTIPKGQEQTELGRNFKLVERTVWISLKAIIRHKAGRLRPTPRKHRIEYFLSEVQETVGETHSK